MLSYINNAKKNCEEKNNMFIKRGDGQVLSVIDPENPEELEQLNQFESQAVKDLVNANKKNGAKVNATKENKKNN